VSEPRWLPVEEAIAINADEVGETGEPHLLRDRGLLESALARPQHLWAYTGEQDIARLAAALLFGIAKNHPFAQGNKRTAWTAALVLIELNGYRWTRQDDAEPAEWVLQLLDGRINEDEFAEALRPCVIVAP
jgi:death on curing protein